MTIRGKQYECIYSETLGWWEQTVYANRALRYERMRRAVEEREVTADEAEEFGKIIDSLLTTVIPSMSPRTLKKLHTGERWRILRTFFDLEAPATRRLTMDAALMMLASLSPTILTSLLTQLGATGSSQPSPEALDSA